MPYLNLDGTKIHYRINHNDADREAQKVLYVHGTGCNGGVFERHMGAITGHSVAAIDLPGHGKSAGKGYCGVVDHARIVADFIEALDWQGCILAGHSLGGGIVIASAIYFGHLINGLILIDTGARLRVSPAVIERAKKIAAGSLIESESRQGFSDSTPQAIVDELRGITADEDPAVTLRDWYADDSCDFLSRVGKIEHPSIAICGRDDQLTPLKYHEYLQTNMPNCALAVIDDAGHWPFVEQPIAFDQIVDDFLKRLS